MEELQGVCNTLYYVLDFADVRNSVTCTVTLLNAFSNSLSFKMAAHVVELSQFSFYLIT